MPHQFHGKCTSNLAAAKRVKKTTTITTTTTEI